MFTCIIMLDYQTYANEFTDFVIILETIEIILDKVSFLIRSFTAICAKVIM